MSTTIAMSIDVERLFSHGQLLLSHVRSCLSSQSTRALLCLGFWSRLGYIDAGNVLKVSKLPDINGEEEDMGDDWGMIVID